MGTAPGEDKTNLGEIYESAKGGVVTIRHAKVQDAPGICSLGSKVFSDTFGYSVTSQDLEAYLSTSYSLEQISKEVSDPQMYFLVAVDESDQVVGFSQMTEGTCDKSVVDAERPIELQRLYLAESQHGTGLAKRLVERIESIAVDRGYKVMWLGVWEFNPKAQKFYTKMGFSRVGEHDFVTGACAQTDWILSKRIAE